MQVRVAFMSQPSTDGSAKRFVVFDARAADGNNQALLRLNRPEYQGGQLV